ncbi:MAG: PAS domain-containing protein [Pseudomonadales bacterium]|nr:PAS domain-containing protein [Pseudomonadales bacterium]
MESRATQANTGGLTPSSVIAVLSDDANTISLIKHILAMSKQIHFDLNVISSTFFNANQPYDADLVLLDRDFGQRPYNHTVNDLVQAQTDRPLPAIVVLLDEALLADDLSLLASSVKTGVDDFILSSELSLKRILQIISAQPSAANAKPFVNTTATSAAPISTPLSTKLSATTTNTPAETINETTSTTHSTASLESLQDESNQQQSQLVHLLSIDLESRRIHLSQNGHSILMDEADAILTIEEWLQLLDVEGAKKFNSLLQQASEFLAIPKSISCTIKSKSGIVYPADITEIQIKENGQGRVVGINTQILIGSNIISSVTGTHTAYAGFDNLDDISSSPMVEKIWMNIAESLPMMCMVLDQNGYIVKVINSDRSSTHYFPEAQVGQTLNDVFGIDSLDNYVESINKTLNTGKAHQQTIAYSSLNGARWFDTFITKMRGDLGISRQVVWTAFDATAGRQAYQELLKNHDSLTDTLNDAPVIFCQKDADGRYQRVNRVFCETFNVRAEVIAGRNDQDIFSGNTLEQITQQDRELVEQGGDADFIQTETINGQSLSIQWHKFALKGHSNNKVESIAAFGFVCNDTQNIATNKTSNPTENQKPLESSAVIEAEQIIPTMAEPSGAIGQDIKAIIKSIVSYTEMAISQKTPGREQRVVDYLNQVVNASARARDLIIESASEEDDDSNKQVIELKPLVRDIIHMLKPTLPSSINFQTDLENAYGKAWVSPVRFQRIVMQLLMSARDSSSKDKNDSNRNDILLSLKNHNYQMQKCIACNEKIDGDYISLEVKTTSGKLDADDIQKMVEAATKIKNQAATSKQKNNNIIVMAHYNGGHTLIEYDQETITLKLLFKQVADKTGNDDDANGQKNLSNTDVTSLSSL